jgi:two-component system, response regulator YesN
VYKLVVVDDEYESRNTLCNCFPWNEVGFEVIKQFDNGKVALDYLLKNSVDVVLCDIRMPIMSGIDLAKEIHHAKFHPSIVFLSGYRDFEYAQKAVAYGVRYYIVKPSRYEELHEVFTTLKKELDDLKLFYPKPHENLNIDSEHGNFQDNIIRTAQKYVKENYRTATLEDISKLIHMNSSYFSQFFKQKTGCNFSDYLIEIKMKTAAELLKDISLKTYNVSELVGYTNPKNFARTFKSYFGMSPKEFRNTNFRYSDFNR